MRYLVSLSADRGGRDALHLGRMLAGTGDSTLIVCVFLPEVWGHPSLARVDAEYAAFIKGHAENAIAEARAFLGDSLKVEYITRHARSPTVGLIAAAVDRQADFVIVGSARHGALGRFTVGSVSNEMLHASPVCVVLAPRGYRPSSDVRLQRVTCAFAGSTSSQAAIGAAVNLSRQHNVPLRLATFVVRDRQMYPSLVGYDAEALVREQWRGQAQEAQDKALAALPEELQAVEPTIISGRDWDDALDSLAWEQGEVLVVGSSRLGSPARVFLGSNSTKIIRSSPVPVIVTPSSKKKAKS